jgi:CAAX prenyl protease-like protein
MINKNIILFRIIPFAVYILFLALGDYLIALCGMIGVDVKWLYVVRILTVLMLLVFFWRSYTELSIRPKLSQFGYAAIAGLAVLLVWILPYPAWATLGDDVQGFNPIQNQDQFTAFLWLSTRILGAAMIVPVMEELFWRSFLMRWIDSKDFLSISPANVSLLAIIVSAVLFALEHHLWLAGLIAGLVYGLLYKMYKNLWVPIFAHAVTNGLLGIWVVQTGNWRYW